MLSRWYSFFERKIHSFSDSGGSHGGSHASFSSASSADCYACTQDGFPVFHSTRCGSTDQPQWEALAGSSLVPIKLTKRPTRSTRSSGPFGRVLDPRSKTVQHWNRAVLVARGMALAVDPLFFYILSIGRHDVPCLYMDFGLALTATLLRTCLDIVHLRHVWLQVKMAYVSRESMVVGCGKLVWDARAIASHYLRSLKGFWLDAFVILPIPQIVLWLVMPKLIREEKINLALSILLVLILFQLLPKVYHSICLMRKMREVTGYIFGTVWWGFGLNLMAYFIASHVAGGCWYVLATLRVVSCLQQRCLSTEKCSISFSCPGETLHLSLLLAKELRNPFHQHSSSYACLNSNGPFKYGIYQLALPVISSNSITIKIVYPIFWGLSNLSTFGNMLPPTCQWMEVIFSIFIVLTGIFLFTLLVGNIQVSLSVVTATKKNMQLRTRDMEWWMSRRQLPPPLRQRVHQFEKQRWITLGGQDEIDLIKDLPEGLRRDIKRFICIDLIRKVPIFHNMDELILDNICDRVKHLLFSKCEKIIREGDPVRKMVFLVQGRVKRNQSLSKGIAATSVLKPGGFFGDELLSWCLRRPFIDRLPASSATFVCMTSIEAFALDADDLRYLTDHFRYKFANERLKRTARYYSSNWRTWASVNIQLAWRRYRIRTNGASVTVLENGGSDRLLRYAALFLSLRPHDHLD